MGTFASATACKAQCTAPTPPPTPRPTPGPTPAYKKFPNLLCFPGHGATNILNVYSEIFASGGNSAFKFEVMVQNRTQLEALMHDLRQVPDVSKVVRGKDYGQ